MEQLVRFRLLIDSLSQSEFDSFLVQIGQSFIVKGLFYLFHFQLQNQSNNSDLSKASNIISNIIRSRDSNQLKETKYKLTLNDLPFEIIGECASYLQFMDYQSLQNVSRSVFIGCNDPITLTQIDKKIFVRNFRSKQYLKLRKYQKVNHFEINIGAFYRMNSIHAHNVLLSKNIKSLELYNGSTTAMKSLLNSKSFNFDNIETLKLRKLYMNGNSQFSHDVFCNLLKQMKNVKFLELNCNVIEAAGFNTIFNNESFRNDIFNNLQGLCLHNDKTEYVNFYDHLLHYFSDKLLSLHFDGDIKCPKNGFGNLKEVYITNVNYNKINSIKTAKELERIHLHFKNNIIGDTNKLENILLELLNQNTLEFISIKIENHMEIIKNVLQKISLSKRPRLKLTLTIKQNVDEYYEMLMNKFNKLNDNCVINNWMIIFKFIMTEKMKKFNRFMNIECGKKMFVLKHNKQCKINGYRERWLFPCLFN